MRTTRTSGDLRLYRILLRAPFAGRTVIDITHLLRSGSAVDDQLSDHPVSGDFVTETLDYDGGRQVTVYVPPDPPEAVVFAGDGQLISRWGALLEPIDVPSTMIVGIHRLADETLRLHEYSPGFDPDRFAAHETFFVDDVRRWVSSRFGTALPADRTAVLGVSGEWRVGARTRTSPSRRLWRGLLRLTRRRVISRLTAMPGSLPRTYLVAGTMEPFFTANAKRWEAALNDAGADVVMRERIGSHGDAFWQEEFPLMVAWAFGR